MKTKFVNTLKPAESYTHTHTHTHTGNSLLINNKNCDCNFCEKFFHKIIFSSVAVLLSINAYATTDIPGNASSSNCTNTITGTYSGTTNFEAKWTPKNIQLNWYDGDTQITPSNNAARSCTYDGALTIPSNPPSKTGYVFAGWTIKTGGGTGGGLLCGFTNETIDGLQGVNSGYKSDGRDPNNADESNASQYGLTTDNTWAVEFNTGIMRGIASCNDTPGPDLSALMSQGMQIEEAYDAGTITEEEYMAQTMALQNQAYTLPGATASSNSMSSSSTGQYCWCKMESYTPNGGNACNVSQSSAWAFNSDRGSAASCAQVCARNCSANALLTSVFRGVLATASGN